MTDDVLIYGDTERSATMRHEIPLAIGDPFLYVEAGSKRVVVTNILERELVWRQALGDQLVAPDRVGEHELDVGHGAGEALVLEAVREHDALAAHLDVEERVADRERYLVAHGRRALGVGVDQDVVGHAAGRRISPRPE